MRFLFVVLLCSLGISVFAEELDKPPFDQELYNRHRRNVAICLVGAGCLTVVSVIAFLGAENWGDLAKEAEKSGEDFNRAISMYKTNRNRLTVGAIIALSGAVILGLNASRHDTAADKMLKAKVSISPTKAKLKLALNF